MAEQCLEERDGDDELVARFTYSPGYIDAVAVQERDLNSDTDFTDPNEVVYYEQNTLFSVSALCVADGSVIERYRYDAYGGATVLDADGSADGDGLSDVRNPYVFTDRRTDAETGLMQYRHRYYSPVLGRFVSRDPLSYDDSPNLFGYAGGRTTAGRDPSGTSTVVEIGNPKLPSYFTVTGGEGRVSIPMVITGTMWQVYDRKGRVVFREGIAVVAKAGSARAKCPVPLPTGGPCNGQACAFARRDGSGHGGNPGPSGPAGPEGGVVYADGKPTVEADPTGLRGQLVIGGDPAEVGRICPELVRAIELVNAALEKGSCKVLVGDKLSGDYTVTLHSKWKPNCWLLGEIEWTYPGFGIGVCPAACDTTRWNAISLANLLLHELGHKVCPILPGDPTGLCPIFGEWNEWCPNYMMQECARYL